MTLLGRDERVEIVILPFNTVLQAGIWTHCMCQVAQLQAITIFPGVHLFTPTLVSCKSIPICICKNRCKTSFVHV